MNNLKNYRFNYYKIIISVFYYYYNFKNNNKCIIIKILMFVFLNYIILISKLKKKSIKICICTVGKNENRYIKEYIDYYKNYGIDKIFLYDNNNINGENFQDIINKYVEKNFVEIKNWRGIQSPQMMIYNDCYHNN